MMMIRILILLSLFLGFEYFVFSTFSVAVLGLSPTVQFISKTCYWLVTLGVFGWNARLLLQQNSPPSKSAVLHGRAIFNGLLIAKFVVLALMTIGGLIFQILDLVGLVAFNSTVQYWIAVVVVTIGGLVFGLLLDGIWRNGYRYKIYKTAIALNNLPPSLEGLKIVQISDIHSGTFVSPEKVQKGIDLINAQKPDLVFFTGDLVNSIAEEMRDYIEVFSQIRAKYGVYSILGNHDYGDYTQWESQEAKIQNFRNLIATHQKMGWDLLRNEHRMLNINQTPLAIIGVENASASPRFHQYGDLQKAYRGTEQAGLKLLLSHDPSHWDNEVNTAFKDIAVTFSGHTHGFQFGFELSKWLRWSPSQFVYKQWAGLYQKGKQFIYVNRGFGMLGYPGRVGILPEISVIELVSG